jgi:dTDP-4-dehydrorhamnose reductase
MRKEQKLKIAIIGGTGLLGSNLLKLYKEYDVKSFSRNQLNNVDNHKNFIISFKDLENELKKFFTDWKPDIIINTVAIVNLQSCEDNYDYANSINCDIAKILSTLSQNYDSYFIHISTDHYYNDNLKVHNENDNIKLLNNYAKTKYNAEKEVLLSNPKALVVRTNIIGFRKKNPMSFFEWLLDSLQNNKKINLYSNFYTSPISVQELGKILILCYYKRLNGIYNISSRQTISKYQFGIKTAKKFNLKYDNIKRFEFKNKDSLKRALTLGLDVSKIENNLGISMPTIDETLESLYQEYEGEYCESK